MDGLGVFVLGWLGGGVVNWLADALPIYRRPVRPRCPHCGGPRRVAAWLGPIRGGPRLWGAPPAPPCRYGAARRGPRPWIVELACAAFAVWLYGRDPGLAVFLPGLFVGLVFLLIAVIDIEPRLIP